MFSLKNFNWQLEAGSVVFEVTFEDEAAFDTQPDYVLSKLATQAQNLCFNFFEIVFYNSGFTRAGNQVPVSVLLIELPFNIPIKPGCTHPLRGLFSKTPEFANIGKIKVSDWSTCQEAYEFYSKLQNPFPIWHIQHYPLRGNGRSMTLKKLPELNLRRKDFVVDEPFNLLDYKVFNKVFYNDDEKSEVVGISTKHEARPTHKKTQGYLANGTLRIVK